MGEKLRYFVEITTEDFTDKREVDDALQELLIELYDYAAIEQIHVIDKTRVEDENMDALFDLLEDVRAEDVMRSVELVREMERLEDNDE